MIWVFHRSPKVKRLRLRIRTSEVLPALLLWAASQEQLTGVEW